MVEHQQAVTPSVQSVETSKKSNVVPVNEEHEPDFEDIELSNMRKVIAKRLVLSKVSNLYLVTYVFLILCIIISKLTKFLRD